VTQLTAENVYKALRMTSRYLTSVKEKLKIDNI